MGAVGVLLPIPAITIMLQRLGANTPRTVPVQPATGHGLLTRHALRITALPDITALQAAVYNPAPAHQVHMHTLCAAAADIPRTTITTAMVQLTLPADRMIQPVIYLNFVLLHHLDATSSNSIINAAQMQEPAPIIRAQLITAIRLK